MRDGMLRECHGTSRESPLAIAMERGSGVRFLPQRRLDALGDIVRHAGRGGDLLDRCQFDLFDRAEVGDQLLLPLRADAMDVIEARFQAGGRALLAVIGEREAVRLVAHALDEIERLRVARQHDRVASDRAE